MSARGQVLGWEAQDVPLVITPDGGAEQAPGDWCQIPRIRGDQGLLELVVAGRLEVEDARIVA